MDELDAEGVCGVGELDDGVVPGELIGDVGAVADEDEGAAAVVVEGAGDAVAADDVEQEKQVAIGVLLGAEVGGDDLTSGVIDGSDERNGHAAVLEPEVEAGVDLQQATATAGALAAVAVLGGRRLRGLGRPAARSQRRSVARETMRPSCSARSSARCESLQPA